MAMSLAHTFTAADGLELSRKHSRAMATLPPSANQKKNIEQQKKKMVVPTGQMEQIAIKTGSLNRQLNTNNYTPQDLRRLCKQGRLKEALRILYGMRSCVDSFTYGCLLQACIKKKVHSEGKTIHTHMNESGVMADQFLGNMLINMYIKCGSLADARRVFDEMFERNLYSWTVLIAAYSKDGFAKEALALFHQMQKTGIEPNQFAFASVLPACTKLAALKQGMQIHEEIIKCGFESDAFVQSALLDMYTKCGSIENARHVFDKIPQPDDVTWAAMIAGYVRNGRLEEALDLFQRSPQRNVSVWNSMIGGYVQSGLVDEAFELFRNMPERNAISWNSMITGYAQNGFVDEAYGLFQKTPEPNVVSWNAMIAGYVRNGRNVEALNLFWEMRRAGVKPELKTFSSVLAACGNLAALEQGIEIHQEVIKSGLQCDVFVESALVDMYAKCGCIEKARSIFDKMYQRNIVSWASMIGGYAMHGSGKEALKLFEQMLHSGLNPNQVTFLCVLSACCHAGLVEEGRKHFDSMSDSYNITPTMEHYGCMVDLFGRAGLLDEAQNFINKMPVEPNAVVWSCLLGACRKHNNVELGEYVAGRLFELDPENATPYVVMSNMYASACRWDDADNVRRSMKDRGVRKIPGWSWIEVDKQVHTFLAEDMSHPQTQEIYALLEILSRQMKTAGYVPDTGSIYDV